MKTIGTVIGAAVLPSLVAGPLFVLSYAAALTYGRLPQPIIVDPRDALYVALFMIPATIVGFMIAFWVNILGARIMSILAEWSETFREPAIWAAAGAAAGALIALAFGSFTSDGPAFPLIVTSAVCAALCRRGFDWEDEPLHA